MDKIVAGIDLGTTFSAVAYVDDNGRPRIVPNADGKSATPSVVLIEDGRIEVGDAALNQWVTNEQHVVRWIKRAMGDSDYRFQGLSAVEISAEILKVLKRDAEVQLGQPLDEAVITCPAYFAGVEIEATKEAGELAGLNVKEIVKEPTAAAVFFGVEHMHDDETVLVCDLGGGTFDATVLAYEGGVFIPRASMGDRKLGGHDWTMELTTMVADRFRDQFGDDPRDDLVAGQLLYEACEKAKRDFARLSTVRIPCQYQQRVEQFEVTRDDFEQRTESLIYQVVTWSEQALEKAKTTWEDIGRILLVGGSSRLRRLKPALQEASNKEPNQLREADLAVAQGAAIMARGAVRPRSGLVEAQKGGLVETSSGGLVEVVTKRKLARHLGTRAVKSDSGQPRIVNAMIIAEGTELPTSSSRDDFEVTDPGEDSFEVPVVEFEEEDDEDIELVGNYAFKIPSGAKRGDRIKVAFEYDLSGIPKVQAFDVASGELLELERKRHYSDPSPDDIVETVRPRWVVFTVDVSYSMEGAKLDKAKSGVVQHAGDLLRTSRDTMVAVVAFGSSARVVCGPTSQLSDVETSVNLLGLTGTTAMDLGIMEALRVLGDAPQGVDCDIVMLTDGMPDPDRRQQTVAAADTVRARNVTLSSMGVGRYDVDEEYLRTLTPISFVIDDASQIADGFGKLLRMSDQARRGGLTDA